jgi:hypothetical protein
MKIIEKFEVASGSKLNKSKTKALSLNNAQGNEDPISGIQITISVWIAFTGLMVLCHKMDGLTPALT